MAFTTERSYAIGALHYLMAHGWELAAASDGEERIKPTSATAAVAHVMATEHGAVKLVRGEDYVTLSLLFQGGEPDEVIYDYSAKTDETLEEISASLRALEVGK
jgi:hypothetical protein